MLRSILALIRRAIGRLLPSAVKKRVGRRLRRIRFLQAVVVNYLYDLADLDESMGNTLTTWQVEIGP